MSFLYPQPQTPSADTKLANLDEDQMASNQEAIPAPWFCGQTRLAAKWLCDVLRRTSTPIKQKVGKGAASTTGYNYYGDIAGLFCCGLVDEVSKIFSDSNEVWSGSIERGASLETDFQILNHAEARFHWGDDNQGLGTLVLNRTTDRVFTFDPERQPWEFHNIDPEHPDEIPAPINEYANLEYEHPAYRGFFYVELQKFFFGQNRTTVPNFELLMARAPKVSGITLPQDRTAAGCNPVTAIAELITNPRFGLGRDVAILDAASWVATAEALQANQDFYYISPYYTSGSSISSIIGEILGYFDGWIRPNRGKLEIGFFPHDGVVPEVRELSHLDVVDLPSIESPGYADTINAVQVRYRDRSRDMKESAETAFSAFNRRTVGELREKGLDRKFFITRQQAKRYAEEYAETASVPESSGEVVVRAERAVNLDGSKILPGDRFHLDDGHFEIDLIVRCTKRIDKPKSGTVALSWIRERGLFAMDYSSPVDRPPVSQEPPAAITAAKAIELSPLWTESVRTHVAIMAQRPAADVEFFNIWFSHDGTSYDMLIKQADWALRGALVQDIAYNPPVVPPQEIPETGRTATVLEEVDEEVEILIAASGEDLVKLQPQSAQAKSDNTLLLIVESEIFSIGSVIAEGQGQYRIHAFRHRLDTQPAIHYSGAEVWIATRDELEDNAMSHSGFVDQAQRYFKLQTGRIGAVQPLSEAFILPYFFQGRLSALPVITFDPGNPITAMTGEEIHISGLIEDQNEDITGWTMSVVNGATKQLIGGETGLLAGAVSFNVPHIFLLPGATYYFEVTATDFENQAIGYTMARWPAVGYLTVEGDPIDPGSIADELDWIKDEIIRHYEELKALSLEIAGEMDAMNRDFIDQLDQTNLTAAEIREQTQQNAGAIEAMTTKITQLGTRADGFASAITNLKQTYSNLTLSIANDFRALRSELDTKIAGARDFAATAVAGLRTEVSRTYAKSTAVEVLESKLESAIGRALVEIDANARSISSAYTSISTIDGKVNGQATIVNDLQVWLNGNKAGVALVLDTFIKDGKLASGALLQVDADGNVASLDFLAGGGSSQITFNADRFYFRIGSEKYQLRDFIGTAVLGGGTTVHGKSAWFIRQDSLPMFVPLTRPYKGDPAKVIVYGKDYG